jgi:hypothetical protein
MLVDLGRQRRGVVYFIGAAEGCCWIWYSRIGRKSIIDNRKFQIAFSFNHTAWGLRLTSSMQWLDESERGPYLHLNLDFVFPHQPVERRASNL